MDVLVLIYRNGDSAFVVCDPHRRDAKIKPLLRQPRALPSFVPNINILYSGKSSEDQSPKTKLTDDMTRLTSRAEVSHI